MSLKSNTLNVPTHPAPAKRQRVLACVLCQQRKVKCNRQTPCNHCIKSRVECIPSTQVTRRRKRRFPEQELLERLHKYEELLRRNNIAFQALDTTTAREEVSTHADANGSDDELSPAAGSNSLNTKPDAKYGVASSYISLRF